MSTIAILLALVVSDALFAGDGPRTAAGNEGDSRRVIEALRHAPYPSADPGKPSGLRDEAIKVLNYCLANPNSCSMSINHISGGWQRHYNASRLNVIASQSKLIQLLAYGDAVANGTLSPNTLVDRDEWTRFLPRMFSFNTVAEWRAYGEPRSLTLDKLVLGMLEYSDNAMPDYLLYLLGKPAMEDAIRKWAPGYFDPPQSIGAISTSWVQNPTEPDVAYRMLDRYSGYESLGYRQDVDNYFLAMQNPAVMDEIRRFSPRFPF
jgi:hypothetical protein